MQKKREKTENRLGSGVKAPRRQDKCATRKAAESGQKENVPPSQNKVTSKHSSNATTSGGQGATQLLCYRQSVSPAMGSEHNCIQTVHAKIPTLDIEGAKAARPTEVTRAAEASSNKIDSKSLQSKLSPPKVPLGPSMLDMDSEKEFLGIPVLSLKVLNDIEAELVRTLYEGQRSHSFSGCLSRHRISERMRATMVNWMIDVMYTLRLSQRCFFLSVALMDAYYLRCEDIYDDSDIHLAGVTCIYVASKLEEVQALGLSVVYSKIGREVLSQASILARERALLQTLQYEVLFTTPAHFLEMYRLVFSKLLRQAGRLDEEGQEVLQRLQCYASLYTIMAAYDYSMLSYYPGTIAAAAFYAAALKLSRFYLRTKDELLVACMRCLSGQDAQQLQELESCAKQLTQLEAQFDVKYPSLFNVFTRSLPS